MITILLSLSLLQDDDDQLTPARARERLEEIRRLMSKAEELLNDAKPPSARQSEVPQKRTLEELEKLLKAAPLSTGAGRTDRGSHENPQQRESGGSADKNYDPARNGRPDSVFRTKHDRDGWNPALPKKIRDAMLSGQRHIDEYPAEFAEWLRAYYEEIGK